MFLRVSKKTASKLYRYEFSSKNTEPKLGVSDTTQTQAVDATFGPYLY